MSPLCRAGVVDHQRMYDAYLANDMDVWRLELEHYIKVPTPTFDDKLDITNYIFGYVSTLLDKKNVDEAERWLTLFESYITELENSKADPSLMLVYRSSVSAYRALLYPGGCYSEGICCSIKESC